jgi:exodeoxyribonuclease V gamma subunit
MSMVYISGSLEDLSRKLAESISVNTLDILAREVIITQTPGMKAWLKRELARINGSFINFSFLNQESLFNALNELLTGEKSENRSDINKYRLYDLLDDEEFKTSFTLVADYYKENELRRFQLAGMIADLFDQYQIYRSDIVSNWEIGKLSTRNKAEEWQKWLWLKLDIPTREQMKAALLEKIVPENREIIRTAFPRISFFGISIYTKYHIEVFRRLAEYTLVDFYLALPDADGEFDNPLLQSWGTKVKELKNLFPDNKPEIALSDQKTLLGRIQNQILKDSNDLKITNEILLDGSIQVNSCFTPAREAECFYNYLLDLFEKDHTLRTEDILVMVSDIDKYSPYIKAVFRNAPVNIPFEVSGAASSSDDSIISALEQIMLFEEDDFTPEKVVGLLEQNRVKDRFGLGDCNNIRGSLSKAGIRFGWMNKAKDESDYVSWSQGLEKILLGHAMLSDKEFEGRNPFRDSESSRSTDLLKLKLFAERLYSLTCQKKRECKSMSDWKKWLFEEVMERLIFRDDFSKKDREEMNSIYRALNFTDGIDAEKKFPFKAFLDELKNRLFREIRESSLNTGRVTFSSPLPVRGLPFRVIGFMGLDNGIFPARDNFKGFDLLGEKYIEGDRSRKQTDKSIFLETILSAREYLYLSFTGQSPKDNSEIPPSIVLDELLDYIEQSCTDTEVLKLVRNKLLAKHPLHGFSSRYKMQDSRLFTYLYDSEEEGNVINPAKEEPKEDLVEITTDSFLKFFEHPIVWYFNNILKIYYGEDDVTLPESEIFIPDSLQEWIIKNDIIRIEDEAIEDYKIKNKKEARLPLCNLGNYFIEKFSEETASLKEKLLKEVNGRVETSIHLDIVTDTYRITGIIDGIYGNDLIGFTTSSDSLKYKTRAFLKTLLLCCDGKISTSTFLTKGGGKSSLPVPGPDQAKEHLLRLLEYYSMGCDSPLIFTLEAGRESKNKEATTESILEKLIGKAEDEEYSKSKSIPYMKKLLSDGFLEKLNEEQAEKIKDLADLLNIGT